MSRIGNAPIQIPTAVTISMDGSLVSVQGPKGTLTQDVRPEVKINVENSVMTVTRRRNDRMSRSVHGLTRSLLFNMVHGVEKGWEKKLELVGVGYRANSNGSELNLSVGYSHPVKIVAPEGVTFKVEENTKITVSGFDKALVGQIAAKIRAVRPPEPYQGKGIRYSGEYVRRKAGKAGKVGAK
jgi:large subunit ribosomal protein L6